MSSMTGFARAAGSGGTVALDVRTQDRQRQGPRHPVAHARAFRPGGKGRRARGSPRRWRAGPASPRCRRNARGRRDAARIDLAALESIAVAARAAAIKAGLAPPTMDGLLALRGVLEATESSDDEAAVSAACAVRLRASMRRSPRSPRAPVGRRGARLGA